MMCVVACVTVCLLGLRKQFHLRAEQHSLLAAPLCKCMARLSAAAVLVVIEAGPSVSQEKEEREAAVAEKDRLAAALASALQDLDSERRTAREIADTNECEV